jgi:superoxide reductase
LVCCGKHMILKLEEDEGEYAEKHSPVFNKKEDSFEVVIGSVLHPMEEAHYIEWIEATSKQGNVSKVFLNPVDDKVARAEFNFEPVSARMYCNKHGLWKNK